jgi:hypothetical protein
MLNSHSIGGGILTNVKLNTISGKLMMWRRAGRKKGPDLLRTTRERKKSNLHGGEPQCTMDGDGLRCKNVNRREAQILCARISQRLGDMKIST